jgi:hypothetical protein
MGNIVYRSQTRRASPKEWTVVHVGLQQDFDRSSGDCHPNQRAWMVHNAANSQIQLLLRDWFLIGNVKATTSRAVDRASHQIFCHM